MCVLARDAAIQVLTAVACAPITRTIRGIRSEVELGPARFVAKARIAAEDLMES
ncbi:MAG: hypothetical protein IPM45_02275 [Acidimicrobiales bacterium]|nr:hypothetical protein [Acidimicrobiales bacterium]